jgi:hypothetical protein
MRTWFEIAPFVLALGIVVGVVLAQIAAFAAMLLTDETHG